MGAQVMKAAIIPAILFSFILTSTFALAIPLPHGVDGTIFDLDAVTKAKHVNFSVKNENTGQTINGTTGTGYYSAALNGFDTDLITVTAWNSEHATSRSTTLNGVVHNFILLLNMTMSNSKPQIISTAQTSATQNYPYSYQVQAIDVNNDPLTYNLTSAPARMTITPEGQIKWTPLNDDVGTHTITITVNDTKTTSTQSFTLNVININDAPQIISIPQSLAASSLSYTYPIMATDVDNDPISYFLVQGPQGMSISSNRLIWTPTNDQPGSYPVTIAVSDGTVNTTQEFNIYVNIQNSPPEFSLQSQIILEDQPFVFTINATDANNDTIRIYMTPIEGMTISGNIITWNPDDKDIGEHEIIITASDGNLNTTKTLLITVKAVNEKPTFSSQAQVRAIRGIPYTYQATARDPDGDVLNFKLIQKPSGMEINSNGLISWTPKSLLPFDFSESVEIVVTDGYLNDTQKFTIKVENSKNQQLFTNSTNTSENLTYNLTQDPEVDYLDERPMWLVTTGKPTYKYMKKNPNSTVTINVPIEWLAKNHIEPEELKLMRYQGGWEYAKIKLLSKNFAVAQYVTDTQATYIAAVAENATLPNPESSKIDNPYKITGQIITTEKKPFNSDYTIKNVNTGAEFSGRSIDGNYYALVYGKSGDKLVLKAGDSEQEFTLEESRAQEMALDFEVTSKKKILNAGYAMMLVAAVAAALIGVVLIIKRKK